MSSLSKAAFIHRVLVLGIIFVAIVAAHAFIVSRDLYNKIWWLDILLHTLGGFWLAAVYLTLFPQPSLMGLILFLLAIGTAWEALEFFLDTPFFGKGAVRFNSTIWQLDTLSDLAVNSLAGLLWWGASSYNKQNV